jgi:hypothetical protein
MIDDIQIVIDKIKSILQEQMPFDLKGYIDSARSDMERALVCAEHYHKKEEIK